MAKLSMLRLTPVPRSMLARLGHAKISPVAEKWRPFIRAPRCR